MTHSCKAPDSLDPPTFLLEHHFAQASQALYDDSAQSELRPQSPTNLAHFQVSGNCEPDFVETYNSHDSEILEPVQHEVSSLYPLQSTPSDSPQQQNIASPSKSLTAPGPMLHDDVLVDFDVQTQADTLPISQDTSLDADGEVEEVAQETDDCGSQQLSYPSPSPSASSSSSTDSCTRNLNAISLHHEHSGLLHQLFDEQTCGILSIKDGPGENPWRTLIWPMAFSEPALYYAILSMTACHAGKHDSSLRVTGSVMQGLSMKLLRERLFLMRTDTAVATTLVLAFSESWLSHIHTGIMHLRGAREFILQGLEQQESTSMDPEDVARIRFLRSTWVYMDIIARLTAIDGEDPEDLDSIAMPVYGPDVMVHDIDPLMGCATTLFPFIGAVANLVRQVRRTPSNSRKMVSRAAGLKYVITKWKAPATFQPPQDESLEIDHSRHTAEAYRWATLLYLCQAVPMICSEEPAVLAGRALDHLAAVPISSRSVIIHIFPLLAAGCEAVSADDRSFVEERWAAMMTRMCIGNIDRCWDVVKEVWHRRDAFASEYLSPADGELTAYQEDTQIEDLSVHAIAQISLENRQRAPSGSSNPMATFASPLGLRKPAEPNVEIDPEMTVRGSLHWVSVMTERNWES